MSSEETSNSPELQSAKRNANLRSAAKEKNDEFYTQLQDIAAELKNYREHFAGKVVLCNCDDPDWSSFYEYFSLNFEYLSLSKLVTTHYSKGGQTYMLEYFGKTKPPIKSVLKEDGDFRSDECIELLKQADIVVTNPPFSLFREYLSQVVEHNKKFIILGNNNAITYKEVFKLIKENKIWQGYAVNKTLEFQLADHYPKWDRICPITNKKYGKVPAISWFTNLSHSKRNEEIHLWKTYQGNERLYPFYDNYNAIDVSKVKDIPCDYAGYMGVPITFLDKYNPAQFEILGFMNTGELNPGIRHPNTKHGRPVVNGKEIYFRIIIRNKHPK